DSRDFDHGFMMRSFGRGRLGVRVESTSSGRGARVVEVVDGTPADRIGLKNGDVITRVDDQSVSDPEDLVNALQKSEGRVRLTVLRDGQRRTFETELDRRSMPRVMTLPRMGGSGSWTDDEGNTIRVHRLQRGSGDSGDEEALRQEIRELRAEVQRLRK